MIDFQKVFGRYAGVYYCSNEQALAPKGARVAKCVDTIDGLVPVPPIGHISSVISVIHLFYIFISSLSEQLKSWAPNY